MMRRMDQVCLWLAQWVEARYVKLAAVSAVLLVGC